MTAPYEGRFCPAPFENAVVYDDGSVFFCCPSWLGISAGNVTEAPLQDVWNSPWAQRVRASIHDGNFSFCSALNCPHLQGAEGRIQRKEEVQNPYLRHIIDHGLTELPEGPRQVTVAYDPTCNLSCPSCRTEHYKPTRDEAARIASIHENVVRDGLHDAHALTIAGNGDPFASRHYLEFMRNFEREKYPNMMIALITNGLRLTPEMWDSVKACHGVIRQIHCSVNGVSAESFSYNQRGGDLEKLLPNLRFMGELRRSGMIDTLSLGFYVLVNNFREMPQAVALAREIGADIYFGHILKSSSHTQEEFRRIAVHLPTHPDHQEFLDILRDPIFREEGVRMSNLTCFLPGNEHMAHLVDTDLEGLQFIADLSFDEFCTRLLLSAEQVEQVRTLLNRLKHDYAEILAASPGDGKPSPLEVLARLTLEEHPDAQAITNGLMAESPAPDGEGSCLDACYRTEEAARGDLMALLDEPQKIALMRMPMESLTNITTGLDPVRERVRELIGQMVLADAAGAEPRIAVATWEECVAHVGLDETEAAAILARINRVKDYFLRLYSRTPEGGGESPVGLLARLLADQVPDAAQRFFVYCSETCEADSGRPYADLFAEAEMDAREEIRARLTPEQRARWNRIAITTLLDMPTGHEPFAEEVQRRRRPEGCAQTPAVHPRATAWGKRFGLPEANAGIALDLVHAAKTQYAELMGQPTARGEIAPIERLAHLLLERRDEAQARFVDYSRTECPTGSSETYLEQANVLQRKTWSSLRALAGPEVLAAMQGASRGSLFALPTPEEPFTRALQVLLTRSARLTV